MSTFLSWVYAQASKVYDWFGSAYYTLRNAATNAWNWAVSQANAALDAARSYAYDLLRSAQGGITSAINWLQSQIANIRQGIYEDITALSDWVEWKISQVGTFAVNEFWDAISDVRSFVDNVINGVINLSHTLTDALRNEINYAFGWINNIRSSLLNIIALLTVDKIQVLLSFLGSGLSAIMNFINNPLTFILDVIQPRFISFLCFVIAHALGTTKYDLPNTPTWKDR